MTNIAIALVLGLLSTDPTQPPSVANPDAVAEVRAGTRTTANAAWWGFDSSDATVAFQAAIDSGAKTVVVPYMGTDWIVTPIRLRTNLELIFEPFWQKEASRTGDEHPSTQINPFCG